MFTKKIATLAVATVAAMGFGASNASAFTGINVGDPVYGELVSAQIALGSFSHCTMSSVSGTVGVDAGPGQGGSGPITAASFDDCETFGSPSTVTADVSPAWNLSVNSAGTASISGIDVTLSWGSLNCRYTGAISGAYNQNSGEVTLSGNLNRVSGSFLCPSSPAVTGTYYVYDQNGNPVRL